MNSVPKLFSCSYADCWTEKHFSTEFAVLTPNHTHSHTLFWGCVSRWFGRALAWHARGHRFDPGILHQIRKASHIVWCLFCCCQTSEGLAHPGERRAWTARGSPVRSRYSPPEEKSTTQKRVVFFFLYRRRKRRELPTKGKATAFVDHRMSQP